MILKPIRNRARFQSILILLLFLVPIGTLAQPDAPRREFRGVWIATVDNIDWPSKKGLTPDQQRAEFIHLLDTHQAAGINAVMMQVRPATDAFYPSPMEPWSEWLTGRQGLPPSPYYDPLAFMIAETHKRGMEFHAWCNPYRATFSIAKSTIAPAHITRTHPEWFLVYGGTRYFDPGNKDAQVYVNQVIHDLVSRYDIDAIHFDDYFYPYTIPGKEFPDVESYRRSGSTLSLEDWRRSNVDSIILSLSKTIKEVKPWVRFGISPFGVWRNADKDPEGSNTKAGQTNYDNLYANILLWMKNGWIDYVVPQLYWEFNHRAAPYEVLVDWWDKHSYGVPCYVGLGYFKAGTNAIWKDPTLLPRQVLMQRTEENIQGAVYFSGKTFLDNPMGFSDSLSRHYYRVPALVPPAAHVRSEAPAIPAFQVERQGGGSSASMWHLNIVPAPETSLVKLYVISRIPKGVDGAGEIIRLIPADQATDFVLQTPQADEGKYRYVLTAVNRYNQESGAADLTAAGLR